MPLWCTILKTAPIIFSRFWSLCSTLTPPHDPSSAQSSTALSNCRQCKRAPLKRSVWSPHRCRNHPAVMWMYVTRRWVGVRSFGFGFARGLGLNPLSVARPWTLPRILDSSVLSHNACAAATAAATRDGLNMSIVRNVNAQTLLTCAMLPRSSCHRSGACKVTVRVSAQQLMAGHSKGKGRNSYIGA